MHVQILEWLDFLKTPGDLMQIDKIMCVLVSNTLLHNVYLSILLYSETAYGPIRWYKLDVTNSISKSI